MTRTFVAIVLSLAALPATAQEQLWIDQFGRGLGDGAHAAVSDGAGGVFICGYTNGDALGLYSGRDDVLLARFDASGHLLWTQLLSSPGWERALGMAPDGTGGFFVVGQLRGSLGGPPSGLVDSWLARFDGAGARQWFHNLGGWQRLVAAAPDGAGGVYLVGNTLGLVDAWVGRFDSVGNKLWSVTTVDDWYDFQSATPDGAGGVYVCGTKTTNTLDVQGGLARYDDSGVELWNVEFGTPDSWDEANVVLSDGSGGVFVGGIQSGGFAWFARYDSNGTQQWFKLGGGAGQARPVATSTDGVGGFYVSLGFGSGGVLLKRFDSAGNLLWSHKIVSQGGSFLGFEMPWALAWDGGSGVFVGGDTAKDLGGTNAGGTDLWLARYDGACNSGTTYCTASTTSIPGCQAAIGGSGSPSIANPTGFTISSGSVPGGNLGICFFGNNGSANIPLGTLGGRICVKAPLFRTGPKSSGGSPGVCDGSFSFTLQNLINASPIVVVGAAINAEIWARDPANADGFLLSNGLLFNVCP